MKSNIYALYNPYIECYDLPMVSGMSPEDYVESYRRLIKSDQERAFSVHLEEKKLCLIGEYDDVHGAVIGCTVTVLCDLNAFFDKDFLTKKIPAPVQLAVSEVNHG